MLMDKYKVLTGEFSDLMLGYYGSTIGPKDPEVLKLAEASPRSRRLPAARRSAEAGMGKPERRRPRRWRAATARKKMC